MAFRDWFNRLFSRRESETELVRFYDIDNQRVIQIPTSELAPGVIEAQVQGIEGLVWIDSSKLQQGDVIHPPFTEDIRDYIRQIKNAFKEHRDLTFDEWEDGFRRDTNPVKEIALWSYAADLYSAFADSELSADRRKDIYRCIVACMTSSPDNVWYVLRLSALSHDEAKRVVRRFYYGNDTEQTDEREPE